MLLVKSSVLITLLVAAVSPAASNPVYETNAQRMARGLPPSPPKFGRNIPGRRQPTPVWAAKRTGTSPLPQTLSVSYSGRLEVRLENGTAIGIVRNQNSSEPIGGLNAGGDDKDLYISFTAPATGNAHFSILATNPVFPEPFYVGAAGTSNGNALDLTSQNTIAFTNVQNTPLNSVPVVSTFNEALVVESAIWSIDSTTKEITAQYINPDKDVPATVIAYDTNANKLFFVGNIAAYNENNETPASAVKLFVVSV